MRPTLWWRPHRHRHDQHRMYDTRPSGNRNAFYDRRHAIIIITFTTNNDCTNRLAETMIDKPRGKRKSEGVVHENIIIILKYTNEKVYIHIYIYIEKNIKIPWTPIFILRVISICKYRMMASTRELQTAQSFPTGFRAPHSAETVVCCIFEVFYLKNYMWRFTTGTLQRP